MARPPLLGPAMTRALTPESRKTATPWGQSPEPIVSRYIDVTSRIGLGWTVAAMRVATLALTPIEAFFSLRSSKIATLWGQSPLWGRSPLTVAAVLAAVVICTQTALAQTPQRYALIVSGANGEPSYAEQYAQWRDALVGALRDKLGLDPSAIDVLYDGADDEHASTATAVRAAIERLRTKLHDDDLLLVVLIGHGTFDGAEAKFNLVGPDIPAAEWASLLKPLPGRVVVVNSTSASFPFLEQLAGRGRIVVTATDSPAQRFDTVFPDYFIKALTDASADLDKNGRVSVWEAFIAASFGVRRYYEQRGQLATERSLLDDDGDGKGREAGGDGEDGSAAARTYLDAELSAPPTDEELLSLLQKRAALQVDADELKQRRPLMTPDEYQKEFEQLMIELAKVSREIRKRQKT